MRRWSLGASDGYPRHDLLREYRQHPISPLVLGGMVLYPVEQAREICQFCHEFTNTAPDELTQGLSEPKGFIEPESSR